MRTRLLIAALSVCASGLAAQQLCEQFNPGQTPSLTIASLSWRMAVSRFTATTTHTNVTGMELMAHCDINASQVPVTIWSVDAATGQPGTLLTSGVAQASRARLLYSARLTPAIDIIAGTDYFIGGRIGPGALAIPLAIAGPTINVYTGAGGIWSPYFNSGLTMEFSLYSGTHSGQWTRYGAGKPGAGGLTPKVALQGFPNIGNSIAVQVVDTPPATFAVGVLGPPVPPGIPFPIGNLYLYPIVTSLTRTTWANPPSYATWVFPIPNIASLQGSTHALQGWVLDPAAVDGLSHSDAVEFTIGN